MSCKVCVLLAIVSVTLGICESVELKMKVESVKDCDVDDDPVQEGFSLETNFEDGSLSAKVISPFDIDDTVEYLITVKKEKGAKWVDVDFQTSGGFCDGWEMYAPKAYDKLAEILDLEASCPIPAGTYEVKNFELDPDDVEVDTNEVARYMVKLLFFKDDKPLACREVGINVVEE